MQTMLDQLKEAKTNDALSATIEGLREVIGALNKPKMVLRDAQGRAVGISTQ